ncbi:iron ABC transporter permease [Variovorax paradoxus]|uniref:ABC transporter permease n=1 Tax=Variovorax paradoxus TaxID=34073 RepID=UPI00193244B1|nr:ABC transporter permease subunit [Variovorax paradoxus]
MHLERKQSRLLSRGASMLAWGVVGAFLLITFILPLFVVLFKSLGNPLYENYASVVLSDSTRTIMLRTLKLGAIVTLVCVLLAYPAAYAMTKLSKTWKGIVLALIILPFLTSYLVRTYGWIAILGNNGPIAAVARWVGINELSLNGTLLGLTLAMTHMLLPLMIMPLFAAMSAIDPRQLLASNSLGAKPAETFVRVYLPQTVSGLISGALLVFVVSLGFFITPALIGGMKETTIAQIIYSYINELFDWGRSASLAVVLVIVILALLVLTGRFVNLASVFGVKEKVGTSRRIRARRLQSSGILRLVAAMASRLPAQRHGKRIAGMVLALNLAILTLPLIYVLLVSFQPLRLLALPTDGFSLAWYGMALNKAEWFEATHNSVLLAISASLIALPVGYFLAAKARAASPGMGAAITFIAIGPLVLPHILLALGLYGVYVQLGWLGNLGALALAHSVCALPYVFVNLSNGLASYDVRLDQAAASMGARPMRALWRIKLPILRPALITAVALGFLASFDELIIALFVAGPSIPTLPVRMWAATSQNLSPELAVVGTLLILLVIAIIAVLKLVQTRRSSLQSTPSDAPTNLVSP